MSKTDSEFDSQAVIYGLDDKPPIGRALVLAIQHVLTMFGATVAVPLMLGPTQADGSGMGMSLEQVAILISSVMVCSGIATFIQVTFGSRLPIIQGVSFSFLAAFIAVIAKVKLDGGGPNEMMQCIAGAILVGAFVEMTIGFSGLVGMVRKFLSPVVIGPVIMFRDRSRTLWRRRTDGGRELANFYFDNRVGDSIFVCAFEKTQTVSAVSDFACHSHQC